MDIDGFCRRYRLFQLASVVVHATDSSSRGSLSPVTLSELVATVHNLRRGREDFTALDILTAVSLLEHAALANATGLATDDIEKSMVSLAESMREGPAVEVQDGDGEIVMDGLAVLALAAIRKARRLGSGSDMLGAVLAAFDAEYLRSEVEKAIECMEAANETR